MVDLVDEHSPRRPHRPPAGLAPYVSAGVLESADVHVAGAVVRAATRAGSGPVDRAPGPDDDLVALGVALAVRAVRLGSVVVDLETVSETAAVEEDVGTEVSALDWPDPARWHAALRASPAVADEAVPDTVDRPLRLRGMVLALDRYWRQETTVAGDIRARVERAPAPLPAASAASVDRAFSGTDTPEQRRAVERALASSFSVIAGGPGTGKTTTIARLLAALVASEAGAGSRIALTAPTGKAAARLQEAVHTVARTLDVSETVRSQLLATQATTIHRLLGFRPGSSSRFRHDRANPLPHSTVVVDETSMVSLTMMSRLCEAVRPEARLVLVGDPRQLASVEAGAVLGDIVGPAQEGDGGGTAMGAAVTVLRSVHRFAGGIGALAGAIEAGDAEATMDLLGGDATDVRWIEVGDDGHDDLSVFDRIRPLVVDHATVVVERARAGDGPGALDAVRAVQVLCANRRGPQGVARWRSHVEGWLTDSIGGYDHRGWFPGRPVLVLENDYALDLFNGDTGVVVADGADVVCCFERRGEVLRVHPGRLAAVETQYAMTIHKSQGSQFDHVVVVLPRTGSPILTRELLYTAVTRARRSVTVVGSSDAVRRAVRTPVQRASGLRERLWGPSSE